ncbi:MAG: transglutaminase family protein [Bacteroidales bacterium]|nr:transglutaminase family protein [Bacteroidales bacterium]MDD4670649.1 transglutaminase family protein [Bacteroidales bacterium]
MQDSELKYLVSLFDDDDEVVTETVNRRIIEKGDSVMSGIITYLNKEEDPQMKKAILQRMVYLNTGFKIAALKQFIENQHDDVSLFEGSYIISSLLDVGLDKEIYEHKFLTCSIEYMSESSSDRTAIENVRIFNHIFYTRLHFSTCDTFITAERHALIDSVLKSRKGNPIAVAFIYFMLAQAGGLPIYPLCFPGGFVPVYIENGKELFYINIFKNGEIFLEDRLKNFLTDQGLEYDRSKFKVKDEMAIFVIYMESLQFLYSSKGQTQMVSIIEKALGCFGDERYLSVDIDEEQE